MARANIINMIQNQIDNGATLINVANGNFVKAENIQDLALSEYSKAIKNKQIHPSEVSFDDYLKEIQKNGYIPAVEVLDLVQNYLKGSEKSSPVTAATEPDANEKKDVTPENHTGEPSTTKGKNK